MSDVFERAREVFLQGVAHYEAGRNDAAAQAFEAALALVPGRVSPLVNLAAVQLRLGRPAEALAHLDAALAQEPARVDALCHRGLALGALGHDARALADFEAAYAAGDRSDALLHERAMAFGRLGRHAEALADLQALIARHPKTGRLHMRVGQTLQELGRHDEAFASYAQAVALEPGLGRAWSLRGHMLRVAGRMAEASACYQRAIAAGDDTPENRYFLGATGVGPMPLTAPAAYVRELFDHYAEDFDDNLVQVLRYRGHLAVAEPLPALGRGRFKSALDLGCGTGLAAPLLRPLAERLTGVDLSPRMIELATRSGLYDTLVQADAAAHLLANGAAHDLIVCCDVFIYVGALDEIFRGVRHALAPGGVFGFSVEAGDAGGTDDRADSFELRPSLRYAHSERYLRRLAREHGLEVLRSERGPLREERGEPLEGLFMHLERPRL